MEQHIYRRALSRAQELYPREDGIFFVADNHQGRLSIRPTWAGYSRQPENILQRKSEALRCVVPKAVSIPSRIKKIDTFRV
jgi:hypothetical protein